MKDLNKVCHHGYIISRFVVDLWENPAYLPHYWRNKNSDGMRFMILNRGWWRKP